MRPAKRMRLDLRAFQRERKAGLIVLALAFISAIALYALVKGHEGLTSVYLEAGGKAIGSVDEFYKLMSSSKKPVAVMFESPTCPVCKRMYPYWLKLELREDLPVSFYHIEYSPSTAEVFEAYEVYDTPTFIVFVQGKPVARHVGAFEGGNITNSMLMWALSAAGYRVASNPKLLAAQGLKVYNSKCARCHYPIRSLNLSGLRKWLSEALSRADPLAVTVEKAVSRNMTLEEVYGGYDVLTNIVSRMRSNDPSITSYDVDRASYLLSYMVRVMLRREPLTFNSGIPVPGNETAAGSAESMGSQRMSMGGAGIVAVAASLVAGLIAAFSPCVLPVLLASLAVLVPRGQGVTGGRCVGCWLSSFASVLAVGILFAFLGSIAASFQQALLVTVSVAVVAAGFSALFGVPAELTGAIKAGGRAGVLGFCALYGFLAVQCSLPVVAGALLLAAGVGGLEGVAAAVAFALGISLPLALTLYIASKSGAAFASKLTAKTRLLNLVGGIVLVAAGVYMLLEGLAVV